MGIFDNLTAPFTTSSQDKASADQQAGLNAGYGQLSGMFDQGRNSLSSSLANSTAAFMPNLQQGQAGQTAYGNATGANGPAGNAAAIANFQGGPGYQFNMDQMMQNLMRVQEATGQANSGATNVDTLKQAHGIADQGWQSYISNLAPFLNSSNAAAGGIAAANTNAGNQTNQSFTTQGNAAYGTQAGIGNAKASADLAPLTAGKNLIGGALDVASMMAGLPPMGGSIGSGGMGLPKGSATGGLY